MTQAARRRMEARLDRLEAAAEERFLLAFGEMETVYYAGLVLGGLFKAPPDPVRRVWQQVLNAPSTEEACAAELEAGGIDQGVDLSRLTDDGFVAVCLFAAGGLDFYHTHRARFALPGAEERLAALEDLWESVVRPSLEETDGLL